MLKFNGKVHLNVALSIFFKECLCSLCWTSDSPPLCCVHLQLPNLFASCHFLVLQIPWFTLGSNLKTFQHFRTASFTVSNSNWVRTTAFVLIVKQTDEKPAESFSFFFTWMENMRIDLLKFNSGKSDLVQGCYSSRSCRRLRDSILLGRTQAKYPVEGRDLLTTGHTLFAITKLPPLSVCEILRFVVAALCRGRLDTGSNPSDLYDYPQKSPANCVEGTGTCFSVRTSPSGSFTFLSFSFFNTCKSTPKFNITSTYSCYASLENISTDKEHNRLH